MIHTKKRDKKLKFKQSDKFLSSTGISKSLAHYLFSILIYKPDPLRKGWIVFVMMEYKEGLSFCNSRRIWKLCHNLYSINTRRYGLLRGPTSSSCAGLRPRLFLPFGPFWCSVVTSVTFSSNLSNFKKNPKKSKKFKNLKKSKKVRKIQKNWKNHKKIQNYPKKIIKNQKKLENVKKSEKIRKSEKIAKNPKKSEKFKKIEKTSK